MVDLVSSGVSSTDQQDALSAARSGTVYRLPSFRSWADPYVTPRGK